MKASAWALAFMSFKGFPTVFSALLSPFLIPFSTPATARTWQADGNCYLSLAFKLAPRAFRVATSLHTSRAVSFALTAFRTPDASDWRIFSVHVVGPRQTVVLGGRRRIRL